MPGHFSFYSYKTEQDSAWFDDGERRHAMVSLRYKIGDEIAFSDGVGNRYNGRISKAGKDYFTAEIIQKTSVEKLGTLTVACGILKNSDRMEWMVEKCTELGISEILLLPMKNSERSNLQLHRLEKTAVAALKQSHGAWLPSIKISAWNEILQFAGEKWIAALHQETQSPVLLPDPDIFLIGPEGDFSASELEEAIAAGYKPVSLGKQVLRAETAVVSLAAYLTFRKLK